MLDNQNTTVVYLTVLLILIVSGIFSSTAGIVIFSVITIVYITMLVAGSSVIQMNFYLKALSRGNKNEPKVALTFDDGPDEKTTPIILDILEKHRIKAAFFIIGNKIEKNRKILKQIADKGHLIGNHSWSHSNLFDFYLPGKMVDEIEKTNTLINEITDENPVYFRPPFGVINPFLAKALKRTGHKVMGWSLRTFDTVKDKKQVLKKIELKLSNGDIILLHDTKPETAELLDDVISMIKDKGFEIVRPDQMWS